LESGIDEKPALADLISELTVSESFFFRNPGQFDYLYFKYLPLIFKKKSGNHPFRIWSAGCANGEEAYSLALLMQKFKERFSQSSCYIYGGDINRKNLVNAREGVYSSRAFRRQSREFARSFNIHFGRKSIEGNVEIQPEIKQLVQFRKLNLKKLHDLKCMSGSDIIFCRNVLIYFDEEFRKNLIEEFVNLLVPGGLLCLGESECLPNGVEGLEIIRHKSSYCYRKPDGLRKDYE
jgi:chemotaxis protein methyltransferase CheR